MKQAIFTVVNSKWRNELNVFTQSWYHSKPADVDYILVHDGKVDPVNLNHQPDVVLTIPESYVKRLQISDKHTYLKPGWEIISARIFILDILKDKYDKLLYLDADTLVVDLPALLTYFPQKTIAAVEAEFSRESIDIIDQEIGFGLGKKIRILEQRRLNPSGYVNSGVMIINTERLRNLPFNISELFVRTFKELVFIDQDFINLAFSNDIEYLDRSYNYIPLPVLKDSSNNLVKYGQVAQEYYNRPLTDLKVIHYISGWRPWQPSATPKYEVLDVSPVMKIYREVVDNTPGIDETFRRSVEENYSSYVKK